MERKRSLFLWGYVMILGVDRFAEKQMEGKKKLLNHNLCEVTTNIIVS